VHGLPVNGVNVHFVSAANPGLSNSGQGGDVQGLWRAQKNHLLALERYMPGEEGVGILAVGCKHSGLVKEAVKASAGRLVPEEPLLRSDLRRIRVWIAYFEAPAGTAAGKRPVIGADPSRASGVYKTMRPGANHCSGSHSLERINFRSSSEDHCTSIRFQVALTTSEPSLGSVAYIETWVMVATSTSSRLRTLY